MNKEIDQLRPKYNFPSITLQVVLVVNMLRDI
jgi:hypothetical protein